MIRKFLGYPNKWKLFSAGLLILLFFGIALAAPLLSDHEDPAQPSNYKIVGKPYDINPYPPSPGIPLGSTPRQFDIFHTLVWGTRTALAFGLTITIISASFGVVLGAISGYIGGKFGYIIIRMTETFISFPTIAGVVLFNSFYVSQTANLGASPEILHPVINFMIQNNIHPVTLALIAFSWMPFVKLTHSSVIHQMGKEYIQGAISIGASKMRIIFTHILPNIYSPIMVLAAKSVGGLVILDAGLTYIGNSGATEWGSLLVISRDWIVGSLAITYWWVFFPPTIMIILFGVSWNFLGDQLSSLLSPR